MRARVGLVILVVVVMVGLAAAGSASAATVKGGNAVLGLDGPIGNYFVSQQEFILPMAPVTIGPWGIGWKYTAPVSGGTFALTTLRGTVNVKGGLRYAQLGEISGYTREMFTLTAPRFVLGSDPHITALVNGGQRQRVYELDRSGQAVKRWTSGAYRYVRLSNLAATYSVYTAGLIFDTFGWGGPMFGGEALGVFTLTMRFAR